VKEFLNAVKMELKKFEKNLIEPAKAEGARQERERIRAAVESMLGQADNIVKQLGDNQEDLRNLFTGKLFGFKAVLHILDPKEADNALGITIDPQGEDDGYCD